MRINSYLKDKPFLKQLDKSIIKERFVKIKLLNWQETEIQEITTIVTDGSFNLDGSSSVRRTANLTVLIQNNDEIAKETLNLITIDKKVKIEVGLKNLLDIDSNYKDVDIFWFPMGTYVVCGLSFSHSANGISMSLQLKDKMCLLNGEMGGSFPAAVELNSIDMDKYGYDEYDDTSREQIPTIYQLIKEVVNHWGGEQLGKIIISDVPEKIQKIVKWTGGETKDKMLYLTADTSKNQLRFDVEYDDHNLPKAVSTIKSYTIAPEDDLGYSYEPFTYPEALNVGAGTAITNVLDTIKNTLGNYEYFYDLDGNFVFQEIKNFLNTTEATTSLEELKEEDYFIKVLNDKFRYEFDDSTLIASYSHSPQINMIKNDFVVWGVRTTGDNNEKFPIRYHVVIDEKPIITESEASGKDMAYLTLFDTNVSPKKVIPTYKYYSFAQFPDIPVSDSYYEETISEMTATGEKRIGALYQSVTFTKEYELPANKAQRYKLVCKIEDIYNKTKSGINLTYKIPKIIDWRTKLYYQGVLDDSLGLDSNYYYAELLEEWPKIYDIENGKFRNIAKDDIDYYLDFIDSDTQLNGISVSNIGRRTKILNNQQITCLFAPEVPELGIILANTEGKLDEEKKAQQKEYEDTAQEYAISVITSTGESISKYIGAGGLKTNCAYDEIRNLLYQYTEYNGSITIQCVPIYYLEPNTIITVNDPKTGISGDYLIKTISLPLSINGTMSITATKIMNKF